MKEETRSIELLINQGVDIRFQNMWWVEYQRVMVGCVVGKKYCYSPVTFYYLKNERIAKILFVVGLNLAV